MRIPDAAASRSRFFQRLTEQCLESRDERRSRYEGWRNYYLFGAESGRARFNKLRSHIEDVASLLFASETVRFSASYGARAERGPAWMLETAAEALLDVWHDDAMGLTFSEALPWSYVYGSIILAPRWRKGSGLQLYTISPANFGVANEQVTRIDRQEAVCTTYSVSVPEFIRNLPPGADVEKIMRRVSRKPPDGEQGPDAAVPVVLSNPTGSTNYTGAVTKDMGFDPYEPRVSADVIEMRELWAWDESCEDWRIIIQAAPDVFILDRKNLVSPGRIGFQNLTPNPIPDYFWGASEIEFLSGLQYWRNKRFAQLDKLLQRQENPPRILKGFQGITDEKAAALSRPGATLSSVLPGAGVQELTPNVPSDALEEISALDAMFQQESGISGALFGANPPNIRSHSHAAASAMLASARPKRRAMRVEGCLNDLMALVADILRQEDDTDYKGDGGEAIRFGELPKSVRFKVDGHSSSPIFAAQNQMVVTELFEAGAIDAYSLLEMLNPPMIDTLKDRLKQKMIAASKNPQEAAVEAAAHRKAVGKGQKGA